MLDIRNRLFVFWDDNSSFSDFSNSLMDYGRNSEVVALNSAEDYLYVGFEKPINRFYVEMSVKNTVSNSFSAEYNAAAGFTALPGFLDDSRGFTRSGFVNWERPVDLATDDKTLEVTVEVNGQEAFWYRFRPTSTHDALTALQGLNIVFADDEDIRAEIQELSTDPRWKPSNTDSHILIHQSARDEIIQKMRRWQLRKKKEGQVFAEDITQWDLLDSPQLRMSATYLAVSKIYFNNSTDPEDTESVKSKSWETKFDKAFRLFTVDVDLDDDGIQDSDDRQQYPQTHIMTR